MTLFETVLRNTMIDLRNQFDNANLSHLSVTIEISGPVHRDGLEITFRVGDGRYSDESVTGSDLNACLGELLRRKGWKQKNAPLSIEYMEDK